MNDEGASGPVPVRGWCIASIMSLQNCIKLNYTLLYATFFISTYLERMPTSIICIPPNNNKTIFINLILERGEDIDSDHRNAGDKYEEKRQYIVALELKRASFTALPSGTTTITAGLHGYAQDFSAFEATDKEWNEQWGKL